MKSLQAHPQARNGQSYKKWGPVRGKYYLAVKRNEPAALSR